MQQLDLLIVFRLHTWIVLDCINWSIPRQFSYLQYSVSCMCESMHFNACKKSNYCLFSMLRFRSEFLALTNSSQSSLASAAPYSPAIPLSACLAAFRSSRPRPALKNASARLLMRIALRQTKRTTSVSLFIMLFSNTPNPSRSAR